MANLREERQKVRLDRRAEYVVRELRDRAPAPPNPAAVMRELARLLRGRAENYEPGPRARTDVQRQHRA
jgi:hypothetical protein